MDVTKHPTLSPGHRLSAYAGCLHLVGRALAILPEGSDEDGRIWRFSADLVKYIQVKIYWIMGGRELLERVPQKGKANVIESTYVPRRSDEDGLVLDEIRRFDDGLNKAWKEFEGG